MSYEVKDIKKDIVDVSEHIPVVIDFWAEWCGPCRVLGPAIEKLASKAKGRWKLVKADLENPNNKSLAEQFQIRSIPAVRMIYQGKLVAEFNGALPEAEIKKWLANHLPAIDGEDQDQDQENDDEANLNAAIEVGDRVRSREAALNLYNEDPENDEWKVTLALQFLPDQIEDAEKLINSLQEPERFMIEKEAVETISRLKTISDGEYSLPDSKPAVRYREAAVSLFQGQFDEAIKGFIDVLIADRELDDEGARKACVALFRFLGDKHPVSQDYRRQFSMALY